MSQLRTSSERKLSLSATRQPFTIKIALLFVFFLSNSLFFVSFLRLSDLSYAQEQAGSIPSMHAVAPSPSHKRDGSEKVRTFDKSTHRHKILRTPKIRERLVVTTRSTRSCRSMSSYGRVLATGLRVLAARSEPAYFFLSNFCRFRSKFAWALPLSLSSPWTMNFFSEATNTDKKWKLVPNARLPR